MLTSTTLFLQTVFCLCDLTHHLMSLYLYLPTSTSICSASSLVGDSTSTVGPMRCSLGLKLTTGHKHKHNSMWPTHMCMQQTTKTEYKVNMCTKIAHLHRLFTLKGGWNALTSIAQIERYVAIIWRDDATVYFYFKHAHMICWAI